MKRYRKNISESRLAGAQNRKKCKTIMKCLIGGRHGSNDEED
jgi:hypothetical protein